MSRYDSRFQQERYLHANCGVSIFYQEEEQEEYGFDFPDELLQRLALIAKAYDLHVLSLIDFRDDLILNSAQCQGLLEELDFIEQVVNDPLLHQYIASCRRLAHVCLVHSQWELRFEVS